MMMIWKIAPALAAGNTVVLKPSDTTPASSTLLAELCQEFLPPGVLNVVCGDRDTGRALVEHPTPQMVAITGSVRAGMEVAGAAAADLKRVHLELGGKAPVIVFDDADIDARPPRASPRPGYFNAGQDCTAATRVLVGPGIHDDFVAALTEQARRHAAPACPTTRTSSTAPSTTQTSSPACQRHGRPAARPRHARDRRAPPGRAAATSTSRRCSPACSQDDEQIQDEIFGPVITVQRFTDEAEALRWANGVKYGLVVQRLDQGPRPGDADGQAARLRRGVDQHPHPVRLRDAARRLQALRLRQGPLDVRPRGLHPDQARDVSYIGE